MSKITVFYRSYIKVAIFISDVTNTPTGERVVFEGENVIFDGEQVVFEE